MEDKKVVGSSQHGFIKRNSCLTNMVAFYNEVPGLEDEGRAMDVVYFDFSKGFDVVPHHMLIELKCGQISRQ